MAFLLVALLTSGCPRAGTESGAPSDRVAGAALADVRQARFTVRDAASRVELRFADMPGRLYRVSTPADSGLAPSVTGPAGRPELRLRATGGDGPDTVTILLNRTVGWDLRLPAGGGEQHLDLSGGRVTRLETGAAGLIALRLPEPRGTVPVTLTAGAGDVRVAGPRSTPFLLRLRGGAARVSTPWTLRRRTTSGLTIAARSWSGAPHRYVLDARAPVTSLELDQ